MTDEFHGVTRDEFVADRLLSEQDWADWRAARGWEPSHRPTHAEMVARWAADRAEVERESLEGVAERAVIHDGWATGYPLERVEVMRVSCGCRTFYDRETGRLECVSCPGDCPQAEPPGTERVALLTVHATVRLTGCGDPTIDELRAQLAGLGFDTIDIEEIAS